MPDPSDRGRLCGTLLEWRWVEPSIGMVADSVIELGLGKYMLGQTNSVAIDAHGAIETFVQFDPCMCIAGPLSIGWDVDDLMTKADGVVVLNHAPIFEAEELVKALLFGPGLPGWLRVLWGNCEAAVVPSQVAS
jgi:hypothetical protein